MEIVARIKEFVKENQKELVLVLAVLLISLVSFAAGYLTAKEQIKGAVIIQEYGGE